MKVLLLRHAVGFQTRASEVRSVAHSHPAVISQILQTEAAELLPRSIPTLPRLLAFSSAFLESSTEKRLAVGGIFGNLFD